MSRPSKAKAPAAEPLPATPASAPAPDAPYPVNTPQVAPEPTGAEVAASAPVDPKPKASLAKGHVLRVKGPAKGRWRAGRHFGPEEVEIAAADLSEDEIARLTADPELTVLVVGEA